jgi:hypothetical protein
MRVLLLACLQISCILGCSSTYTIVSGSRTLYYNDVTGIHTSALILPEYKYYPDWVRDSAAKWVWWTATWVPGTYTFKDFFGLAQWAVDRVKTAELKIAGDDWMKVTFNGEVLKNYSSGRDYAIFQTYDIKGKLKGSIRTEYQENALEVSIGSDGNYEGLIYRIEFTFN